MIAHDVRQYLSDGPSLRVDWVQQDVSLNDLAGIMVAMANSQGGTILIGVDENAQPQPIDDPEAIIDHAVQAALATTPPLIMPIPKTVTLDDTDGDTSQIVIVQVPSGMPSVYGHDGRYLRRDGAANIPLTPRDLRRLMLERGELSYENEIVQGSTPDDIDWDKAGEYARQLSSTSVDNVETVLIKRGCLSKSGSTLRPTHAGILLFGKDPQRFVQGSELTAVRFAGPQMTDTHTRQDITGTLIDQIKRAETFLVDHLRKSVKLEQRMARTEVYEYPLEAARELIINAIAHRDYSISGDTIRLFLFSDRMEVHSPGGLPGPITVENIRDERFSRNPVIVQVLADLHFIERLGYGVDRVIELVRAQNMKEPDFQERAGGFTVTLHASPQPRTDTHSDEAKEDENTEDNTLERVFEGSYKGIPINPRQAGALTYLHEDEHSRITNSDLKKLFPDVHPETIRRDLVKLVQKGILVKMGQKRGSYYVLNSDRKDRQDEELAET